MNDTKTFKRYNIATGTVDGTLAYDFSDEAYYPEAKDRRPYRGRKARREREEEAYYYGYDYEYDGAGAGAEAVRARRWAVSPLTVAGSLCAIAALVLMLLARIQLVSISNETVELESRITQLSAEHDRLQAEYDAAFNLKSVEEYAVNVLGMQEPAEDQISYLTGVYPADKAVIITDEPENTVSLGLRELAESFKSYFD